MTETPLAPYRDIDDRLRPRTGLADLRFDPLEAVPNLAESSDDDLLSATRLGLRR